MYFFPFGNIVQVNLNMMDKIAQNKIIVLRAKAKDSLALEFCVAVPERFIFWRLCSNITEKNRIQYHKPFSTTNATDHESHNHTNISVCKGR